jgi:hypothetical protein
MKILRAGKNARNGHIHVKPVSGWGLDAEKRDLLKKSDVFQMKHDLRPNNEN